MKLKALTLNTLTPDITLNFYIQQLGMTLKNTVEFDDATLYQLQTAQSDTELHLRAPKNHGASTAYKLDPLDNYWKYSLFVNDIKRSCKALQHHNINVSEPSQFGDIGYLAHTQDPEQHAIELIERTFEQHHQPTPKQPEYPLGEKPQLGLITLRTRDPIKSIQFYETVCEMQLLVRMYVNRGRGFTLYFLGPNSLTPPNPDIDALVNREWLYQQATTFIELQHYWGSEWEQGFTLNKSDDQSGGFHNMVFENTLTEEALHRRLQLTGVNQSCIESPDGHKIAFLRYQ